MSPTPAPRDPDVAPAFAAAMHGRRDMDTSIHGAIAQGAIATMFSRRGASREFQCTQRVQRRREYPFDSRAGHTRTE